MLMMGQFMTVHYEDDVSIAPHDIVSQGHVELPKCFQGNRQHNMQSREREDENCARVSERERERERDGRCVNLLMNT